MNLAQKTRRPGFTLIELIGVIAIIALLAALLIPRIVEVIRDASVTSTVGSINNVKAAAATYFHKNGTFPSAVVDFDATLVSGGFLEKPFYSKLSAAADIKTIAGGTSSTDEGAFNLQTTATTSSTTFPTGTASVTAAGDRVVIAILPGLTATDALRINQLLDGSTDTTVAADVNGRCKISDDGGSYTARVYIAH